MIGGGGEKKTLRLVAQYADACNLFGGPEAEAQARRAARALRQPSAATTTRSRRPPTTRFDVGPTGENVPTILETMRELHELGFTSVHVSVTDAGKLTPLEIIGRDIIPVISAW